MSKLKSLEEIESGWDGLKRPEDKQIYEHYKGDKYEIVATGFVEDTEVPCVVYRSLAKHTVWVRTAKNFLEEIEYNGKRRPRFTPVEKGAGESE